MEHIVKIGIRDTSKGKILIKQGFTSLGVTGIKDNKRSDAPERSKKKYMKRVEEEKIKAENIKFAQRLLQVSKIPLQRKSYVY